MCGICGVVSADPSHHQALSAMNAAIAHRGPDGSGEATFGLASLGQRRLAVIDSEGGKQPLSAGGLALVFNGEIYNYVQIQHELRALGWRPETRSDTEALALGLAQWDLGALPRLEGMFAFAAWNEAERRLILARDRMGKKPLYYAALPGGGIAFASEIKALLAHPALDTTLRDEAVAEYLWHGCVPAPNTWYRAIGQVPPGHWLVWTPEGGALGAWWDARTVAAAPRLDLSADAATARLRMLVGEAVERRLISDVPLGAFLSGGLDSSIIAAEMRRLVGSVKTFTISFSGAGWYDEAPYAREVARTLGTEHHELDVTPDAHSLLPVLLRHYDEPFGDSSALPTYLLSEFARRHVTVALAGDGGDELFAGYERFGAELWGRRYRRLPRGARALIERRARGRAGRVLGKLGRPAAEGFGRWLMLFDPGELEALLPGGEADDNRARFIYHTQGIVDPLAGLLTYNLRTYLVDDLLVKVDRMSMAHGLEVRAPFLDRALAEWALRLPERLQWRGRRGKWLLRRAYQDVLPATILARPKHGFGVPLDAWFRGPLREWGAATLLADQPRFGRWLDRGAVAGLWADHEAGRRNAGHQLWALLALETWLEQQP